MPLKNSICPHFSAARDELTVFVEFRAVSEYVGNTRSGRRPERLGCVYEKGSGKGSEEPVQGRCASTAVTVPVLSYPASRY